MTSTGTETYAVIESVRRLFEEISKLLGTADSMMAASGWKPRAANTITAGTSAALYAPRKWMPHTLFRFYSNPGSEDLLGCVAVVLGIESEDEDSPRLDEPLVIGMLMDYGAGNPVPSSWRYEYSNWHLWVPDRTDDGKIHEVLPAELKVGAGCPATRMYTLAVPLLEMANSDVLSRRVVQPLLSVKPPR